MEPARHKRIDLRLGEVRHLAVVELLEQILGRRRAAGDEHAAGAVLLSTLAHCRYDALSRVGFKVDLVQPVEEHHGLPLLKDMLDEGLRVRKATDCELAHKEGNQVDVGIRPGFEGDEDRNGVELSSDGLRDKVLEKRCFASAGLAEDEEAGLGLHQVHPVVSLLGAYLAGLPSST